MRNTLFLFIVLWLSAPALAQSGLQEPANHYIEHLTLAINDFDQGLDDLRRITGVRPREIGSDAQLGTQSAVIGLGDNTYLQVMGPDPKADLSTIDPELKTLVLDRIMEFSELTPFGWAIGTHNMDRTRHLLRRAGLRTSEVATGSRKKGWGRAMEWDWARITRPDSRVVPMIVQWPVDTKRPLDRAPSGCALRELRVFTRNYKSIHALISITLLDAEPEGAEEDAFRFTLECDGDEVVFDPVSLMGITKPPARPRTVD